LTSQRDKKRQQNRGQLPGLAGARPKASQTEQEASAPPNTRHLYEPFGPAWRLNGGDRAHVLYRNSAVGGDARSSEDWRSDVQDDCEDQKLNQR